MAEETQTFRLAMSVDIRATLGPFRNDCFSLLNEAAPVKASKIFGLNAHQLSILNGLRLIRPPFRSIVVDNWPAIALKSVFTVLFIVASHLILEFVWDGHSLRDFNYFVHWLFRFVVVVFVSMLVVLALMLGRALTMPVSFTVFVLVLLLMIVRVIVLG